MINELLNLEQCQYFIDTVSLLLVDFFIFHFNGSARYLMLAIISSVLVVSISDINS